LACWNRRSRSVWRWVRQAARIEGWATATGPKHAFRPHPATPCVSYIFEDCRCALSAAENHRNPACAWGLTTRTAYVRHRRTASFNGAGQDHVAAGAGASYDHRLAASGNPCAIAFSLREIGDLTGIHASSLHWNRTFVCSAYPWHRSKGRPGHLQPYSG
jgi:hypothetical protein